MANSIALRTQMIPELDYIYKEGSKSSVLDYNGVLMREGMDAKTIQIAKRALQGLGDYARENGGQGFVEGDVTLTWETHTFTHDRGRSFIVDNMDNVESANTAFGALSEQFIREFVAPEVDAIRFSTMAAADTYGVAEVALTASTVKAALDDAIQAMDDNEVTESNRFLFVSNEVYNFMKNTSLFTYNLDATQAQGINSNIPTYEGMPVIRVPKSRFVTEITLQDGTTAGQEAGGFIKTPTTGRDINFMIVQKDAVAPIVKHAVPRYFSPEVNQDADSHKYQYRIYHDIFVLDNKVNGIYLNPKNS